MPYVPVGPLADFGIVPRVGSAFPGTREAPPFLVRKPMGPDLGHVTSTTTAPAPPSCTCFGSSGPFSVPSTWGNQRGMWGWGCPAGCGMATSIAPSVYLRGLADITSDVGGAALRIGGVGVGALISPIIGVPSWVGGVVGYLLAAGVAKLGGES